MRVHSVRRSILASALLAALGLPAASSRASSPVGPEELIVGSGLGPQRNSDIATGPADWYSYYASQPHVVVYVDDYAQGRGIGDLMFRSPGSTIETVLGIDPDCAPETTSVAANRGPYGGLDHVVVWGCTSGVDSRRSARLQHVDAYGSTSSPQIVGQGYNFLNIDHPVVSYNNSAFARVSGAVAFSAEVFPGRYVLCTEFLRFPQQLDGSVQQLTSGYLDSAPLEPAVATDADGTLLVAWVGMTDYPPISTAVQFRMVSPDSYPAAPPVILDQDGSAVFGNVTVAQGNSGQKVVAWTRDGGVFAQRVDAGFQPVGPRITVAPIDGTIRSAVRVTVDEREGFWVGWQATSASDVDGEDIYVRQYRRGGAAVDDATRVNGNTQHDQLFGNIGSTQVGNLTAAWSVAASGASGVYHRTMTGLNDDDFYPAFRVNGTEAGQFVQVDIDFRGVSYGPPSLPLGDATAIIHLPPDRTDVYVSGFGCTGIGTTTLTCPVNYVPGVTALTFYPAPPSGDIPISVTLQPPFVDGNPDDDTISTVLHVRDTVPDAFDFTDLFDVEPGTEVTSAPITLTGFDAPQTATVSGGTFSLDGVSFIDSGSFTATPGQQVWLRHTAAPFGSATVTTTLSVHGVGGDFTSTTRAVDTLPDGLYFAPLTNVEPNSVQTSAAVKITGVEIPVAIGINGGSYSIDGAPFTSDPGTVTNGQVVRVRHTAAATFNTLTHTTLVVGTGVADFTSTTRQVDSTPDPFAFVDVTDVGLGTDQVSNAITVSGIEASVPISIAGGSYSINGGAYTSAAGTVQAGQSVRVRQTAATQFSTATHTTLTIGGVSDTFTSTTLAADATPDAFSFTDVSGVALSSLQTSSLIVVSGANTVMPISIVGGSFSINGGPYGAASSLVASGSNVRVRHTSSAQFSTATNTTLTIGGVSDTFTSTTLAADTTPNAFSFADVTGVNRNAVVTSSTVTISGINSAAPISISGGNATYSRNGGAYTAAAGSVNNGDTVTLKVTSAAGKASTVNVVLTVGGVSDTWSVTTK